MIIGGHVTPALAVIEEIRKRTEWDIVWVGRKLAMEGEIIPSLEYQLIPNLDIPFYTLDTGRFQRKMTRWTIPSLLRTPRGFFQALLLLLRVKPSVVLSFGGYLSFPVTLAAWILRVPIVVHEQTVSSGLANRMASTLADVIAVSHATSSVDFPHHKTVITGNPLRGSITRASRKLTKPPLIFITGGSQGSRPVNRLVAPIISKLLEKYKIVHQTGVLDYKEVIRKRNNISSVVRRRYRIIPSLSPDEAAHTLSRAALVIGRSGANTTAEIAWLGIPAILIPIPWSERGEQERNARLLEWVGLARVLPQDETTPKMLLNSVTYMFDNPPTLRIMRAARRLVKRDAAKRLVDLLSRFVER